MTSTQDNRPIASVRRKLQRKVAVRMAGICFFGCLTGFLVFDSPYWMAGIWTALITAGLFIYTLQFVDKSERKLTAFLQAIKQNDFAVTFSENPNTDDYDLHHAFNQLNEIKMKQRGDILFAIAQRGHRDFNRFDAVE